MGKNEVIMNPPQDADSIVWGAEETIYSADTMLFAKGAHEYIRKDINDIKNNYVKLGFHLAECQNLKYYECFGYSNFYDYVLANFGLDKSATSRCVNVFNRFSAVQNNSHKMFLDDKWKDYNYSQLSEMLPLDDDAIKAITPDMTVKQIREVKKQTKASLKIVATSQPSDNDILEADNDISIDIFLMMFLDYGLSNRRVDFEPMSRLFTHESYGKQFLKLA